MQNYERGRVPEADILMQICWVFKKTIPWLLTGKELLDKEQSSAVVRETEAPYPDRRRDQLVREIKRFAMEADPASDSKLINALLENVIAFREVLGRRHGLKNK